MICPKCGSKRLSYRNIGLDDLYFCNCGQIGPVVKYDECLEHQEIIAYQKAAAQHRRLNLQVLDGAIESMTFAAATDMNDKVLAARLRNLRSKYGRQPYDGGEWEPSHEPLLDILTEMYKAAEEMGCSCRERQLSNVSWAITTLLSDPSAASQEAVGITLFGEPPGRRFAAYKSVYGKLWEHLSAFMQPCLCKMKKEDYEIIGQNDEE